MLGLFSRDSPLSGIFLPSLMSSASGYIFFTLPFVLYILARWRQHRETGPDPHLGIKVALGYFSSAGMQVALAGAALLLYAMVSKDDDRGTVYRSAGALIIPGLVVWFAHRIFLLRTNQETFPGVRRLIAGMNLLVVGALGFVSLCLTFQALFAKGSSGELGRLAVSSVIVYGCAWTYHGWRVASDRLGLQLPPALEAPSPTLLSTPTWVHEPVPTATTPPLETPKADPSKPGLPALGGGSFPPIGK